MKILKREPSKYLIMTDAHAKSFERKCKFIYWIRKLEFVFFNMVLADSLFIMTHCLSVISFKGINLEMSRLDSFGDKAIFMLRLTGSMLIFIAILVDMLELFVISISISREVYYTIPEYELEKLKNSKEGSSVMIGEEISSQMLKLRPNVDDFAFENNNEYEDE